MDKFYNDLKDWIWKFSNKFDVGIVYVFNVGINRIIFIILLIRSDLSSLKFVISIFGILFIVYIFFLNLHYFFSFFFNKNCKVRKTRNPKNVLVGGGGKIQLFKLLLLLRRKKIVKHILTSSKKYIHCNFFQSCVINHLY